MLHSLTRAPLDVSLLNLENSLGRARVDRDACMKHVERARERLRLLTAIIDSLRDLTAEVTPEFHGEDLREMVEEAVALVKDRPARHPISTTSLSPCPVWGSA